MIVAVCLLLTNNILNGLGEMHYLLVEKNQLQSYFISRYMN